MEDLVYEKNHFHISNYVNTALHSFFSGVQ